MTGQQPKDDLRVDVAWREQYTSASLNQKFAGVIPTGVYKGFDVAPGVGLNVVVGSVADDNLAVVERDNYSLTARMPQDKARVVAVEAGRTNYIVIEVFYAEESQTTVEIKAVSSPSSYHVTLATVTLGSGATSVTEADISYSGRVNGSFGRPSDMSRYTLPRPDFHLPLVSDIHIREGFGTAQYSRASGAYETSKSGALVWRDVDEPRQEEKGLLVEGASTNLLLGSRGGEENWGVSGSVTIEHDGTLSPDANFEMDLVTNSSPDQTLGSNQTIANIEIEAGDVYCLSVYVKKGNQSECHISVQGSVTGSLAIAFNFDDESFDLLGNNTILVGGVIPLPNGIYRIWVSAVFEQTSTGNLVFYRWPHRFGNPDGNAKTYFWGQQIEKLGIPSSFIPTEGSPVTRAADITNIPIENNVVQPTQGMTISADVSFICGALPPDQSGIPTRTVFYCGYKQSKSQSLHFDGSDTFRCIWNASDSSWFSPAIPTEHQGDGRYVCVVGASHSPVYFKGVKYGREKEMIDFSTEPELVGIGCNSVGGNQLWGWLKNFEIRHFAVSDEQAAVLGGGYV